MDIKELLKKDPNYNKLIQENNENVLKAVEALFGPEYQKNANEVMHTANTGAGEELVPSSVLSSQIIDVARGTPSLLSNLPAYHGSSLQKKMDVPIIGDPGYFDLDGEKTTGAFATEQGNAKVPTDKIQIEQKKYKMAIDISEEELRFSVVDLEARIREKLARAYLKTVESLIINGDPLATATGNMNSDDATPPTNAHYKGGTGIRKAAFTGSWTKNVGSMDMTDILGIMKFVYNRLNSPSDGLWLFNPETYAAALGIADFMDAAKRGAASTIAGNAITSILGSDLITSREMKLTEADGKMSATPASNTLGQFGFLDKYSVQYGSNGNLELRVVEHPSDGIQIIAWFYFGFAIVTDEAGATAAPCAIGYNVTL